MRRQCEHFVVRQLRNRDGVVIAVSLDHTSMRPGSLHAINLEQKMTVDESRTRTILAVRESALELGLRPLDDAIVDRVVEYGIEAVVECTLALDQPYVVDVNVRGVMYARSIERISRSIAANYREQELTV